jgi:simple sugar transport system permease protein
MGNLDLGSIFTLTLFAAMFRMTTPILFATMGGIFSSQSGIFNVGLEALLIIGAFFAVVGSVKTGNPLGGLLFAVAACIIASLIFALLHLELKANAIIVGLAMNIFAAGMTNYLLVELLGATGVYQSDLIIGFKEIQIPFIQDIPFLGELVSGHYPLVYVAFLSVWVVYLILYKTPFGFHLRAVGEKPEAAESIGINPKKMKYFGLLASGLFSAFGGTFLSLSYLTLFAEGMTAGRGWLALAAINFGSSKPVRSMIACLIFGFTDALAVRLQQFGFPSQIVLMLPYISTLIVLLVSAISDERRKKAVASKHQELNTAKA